jgi:hypothetical protein
VQGRDVRRLATRSTRARVLREQEGTMIVVRDVFQLKFGKAREAQALWQEGREFMKSDKMKDMRILTDLAGGPYYTLVMETTYDSLADFEGEMHDTMNEDWRKWYQRFVPLVDGGRREIFNVVGTTVPPLKTAEERGRKTARA